jgi:ATP-dependent helicase/nuclease subunit B
MEARLQQFDRLILGSLTEGSWPASTPPDPWMSRPMRKQFGLPAPERAIGQSAHDVYMFCAAPEIILTHAQKVEGSPTIPSRWLVPQLFITGDAAPVR